MFAFPSSNMSPHRQREMFPQQLNTFAPRTAKNADRDHNRMAQTQEAYATIGSTFAPLERENFCSSMEILEIDLRRGNFCSDMEIYSSRTHNSIVIPERAKLSSCKMQIAGYWSAELQRTTGECWARLIRGAKDRTSIGERFSDNSSKRAIFQIVNDLFAKRWKSSSFSFWLDSRFDHVHQIFKAEKSLVARFGIQNYRN